MLLSRVLVALSLVCSFGFACSDDDSSTPRVDAGPSADADPNAPDAMPGAPIAYLQPCDIADDLCDSTMSLVCFPFNMKGPHCTHGCAIDGDCEAPSPGCSGMDVCKVP